MFEGVSGLCLSQIGLRAAVCFAVFVGQIRSLEFGFRLAARNARRIGIKARLIHLTLDMEQSEDRMKKIVV